MTKLYEKDDIQEIGRKYPNCGFGTTDKPS